MGRAECVSGYYARIDEVSLDNVAHFCEDSQTVQKVEHIFTADYLRYMGKE